MNIYIVLYYFEDRFDGIYGVYKSDKEANIIVASLEDAGFRCVVQMFHMKVAR